MHSKIDLYREYHSDPTNHYSGNSLKMHFKSIDNLIKEITEELNITTIINSHDMNSVMEIGEKIIFLRNGILEWEGSKKNIFKTDNQAVTDFVYSSNLYKKVRKMYLNQ